MSCKSSEPEDDGGDGEFGCVVGRALGIAINARAIALVAHWQGKNSIAPACA